MYYFIYVYVFLCQAEDGIRDLVRSRGLGDVYKRQATATAIVPDNSVSFSIGGAPTDNTSCIASNGTVNLTINPPNPGSGLGYTYQWSNSLVSEDLSNLSLIHI